MEDNVILPRVKKTPDLKRSPGGDPHLQAKHKVPGNDSNLAPGDKNPGGNNQ
jgi:hypothetical protein